MSKRSRSKDNSKRPQPMVQQRAQAHQSGMGTPKAAADKQQSPAKQEKKERSGPKG